MPPGYGWRDEEDAGRSAAAWRSLWCSLVSRPGGPGESGEPGPGKHRRDGHRRDGRDRLDVPSRGSRRYPRPALERRVGFGDAHALAAGRAGLGGDARGPHDHATHLPGGWMADFERSCPRQCAAYGLRTVPAARRCHPAVRGRIGVRAGNAGGGRGAVHAFSGPVQRAIPLQPGLGTAQVRSRHRPVRHRDRPGRRARPCRPGRRRAGLPAVSIGGQPLDIRTVPIDRRESRRHPGALRIRCGRGQCDGGPCGGGPGG